MKTKSIIEISAIFLILLSFNVHSQPQPDTTMNYLVEMTDGNEFIGKLILEDSTRIILFTEMLGKLTINKEDIKKSGYIPRGRMVNGKIWHENPQSSRYFWSPNGYGLHKGEGYYQNIWVFWNQVSFGVTENFSLGFGIIPFFLFGGEAGQYSPIWIVPKLSFPVKKDKLNLGVGILAGNIGFESNAGFGIAYGLGTIGNRDNNFTFGLGYGYAGGYWTKRPLINISFMARTGPRGYFISENYYISAEEGSAVILSLGGRSFARKVGIDYGLFIPLSSEMDFFIAFPWLGFTVPFDRKKK